MISAAAALPRGGSAAPQAERANDPAEQHLLSVTPKTIGRYPALC
jgi:hypothetical protein